ncbi:SMP-30/gluconolactonase/LRE family protein [Novosphingobium sp. FSY-8]|uniref:SMP-30/gluconolactonase/LRE family protein n=1 Tax=Novosphingobium ovatum TaxID=1908523 RepID=A0ABW9XA71_9SPHN|nr:SMP-30/gluconolactonase/LRE family protein [Novosphingobium ovatum]NBC35424.1 SMP-30/gluconolactonase/LRE family protein [Novosphingobium ovatum]
MKIERVPTVHCLVGEGPLWDEAEQALYFIDIVGKAVHRYDPATQQTQSWDTGAIVGSMALRRDGGAIVALKDGVHTLDFTTGAVSMLAPASHIHPRAQMNDGKVDRAGRFIVGSGDSDIGDCQPYGTLYALDADHALRELDRGIAISNGPCWSPDNRTLYFSDSLPYHIYAYDYDITTGTAHNRRLFADTRDLGGIPDGATVDADGLMWIAICEGAKVVAYRPDGGIERIIDMPIAAPSSVMFGGPNLDELYVTSIDLALLRRPNDGGGDTFVITGLGTRGIAEPRYAG